jgi:hypothetical protein
MSCAGKAGAVRWSREILAAGRSPTLMSFVLSSYPFPSIVQSLSMRGTSQTLRDSSLALRPA